MPRPAATLPRTAIWTALNGQVERNYASGAQLIRFNSEARRDRALEVLQNRLGVVFAQANRTLHSNAFPVGDPGYRQQWGLNNQNDVDIDAPEAWSIAVTAEPVVVAVIDTGIDVNQPDLRGRLWTNPGEIPDNGLDDDRNGYIDDIHGWNFAWHTSDITDVNGHGTHISGIIAAEADNGYGIAGVAPNARIMALRFLDARGDGNIDDAVTAIYYAVANGARVINASWGGGDRDPALKDAIAYASARGVVVVTAAGNEAVNNAVIKSFPASWRLPNLVSVAAVDSSGRLASFSNFGASSVRLAAPGVGIRSTIPGGLATYSGTSMATPFVSGVAALVLGMYPRLHANQAVALVTRTAKPLTSLAGKVVSGGIVDAFRAIMNIRTHALKGSKAAGSRQR